MPTKTKKKAPSRKKSSRVNIIKIDKRLKALDKLLKDGRQKCQLEVLSINRQIDDLQNGHKRGLVWDEDEVQRVTALFSEQLVHWKTTKWARRNLDLEPWQEHAIIAPLFGWYAKKLRSKGGVRRYKKAGVELPRKNGKSTMAAGIAIQGLVGDKEPGAEVYSAATMRDQASIVFKDAKNILSPELKARLVLYRYSITYAGLNGILQPLASDHNSLDGLNASRIIVDELHAHKTRDLYDVLITSMGSRTNPMLLWISTAGYDRQSIWYEEHSYCKGILEGSYIDDAYFSYMTGIDEGDDWTDPEIHRKANPNYGISVSPTFLSDELKKAKVSPAYENTFRRLHLNQLTEQSVRWLPMDAWDKCKVKFNTNREINTETFERSLIGRKCYAGLDLASTRDLCAWGLVFPMDNGKFRVKTDCFAPAESASKRQENDQRSYKDFAARGMIKLTPGSATDYSLVRAQMSSDAKKYDICQVGLDPYNMENFYQVLMSEGWSEDKVFYFKQTYDNYNEAMGSFLELVMDGKIEHDGNEALRWMASNLCVKMNHNEYIMPDKKNSQDKIDGMVSILMGFALAIKDIRDNTSIYEQPGNLMI